MFPALIPILVLVVLTLAAHLPVVRQFALEYGREYLRSSRNVSLEVGRLDYNLFALSTTLEGVKLQSTARPDLPPFLVADEIYLNLRLRDLVRGQFTVEESRFTGLTLQVVVDREGRSNIPEVDGAPSRPAESGARFLVESLEASGPKITFEDRQQQTSVELPGWQASIRGDRARKEHLVRFETARAGSATLKERELRLGRVSLELGLQADALQVNRAGLELGDSDFSIKGRLTNLSDPLLDLTVSGNLVPAQILPWLDLPKTVDGRLRVEASLRNSLDNLEVSADLAGDELAWGAFRRLRLKAKPIWSAGTQRLIVNDVSLQSPSGSLQGRAELALSAQAGESSVQAKFANLDLRVLARQLEIERRLASLASGDMDLHWPGLNFDQPAGRARARLAAASVPPSENLLPVSGTVSLEARAPRMVFALEAVRAAGAVVNGELSLESLSSLSGELRAGIEGLAQTTSDLNAFLGRPAEEPLLGTPLDGPAELRVGLGGTLASPEFSVTARGRGLEVADLREVDLDVDLAYRQSRLDLRQAELRWKEQTVTAEGQIDLEGDSPSVDLRLRADQTSIGDVLAGLGKPLPIEGVFDATSQVTGTFENPSAEVALSGTQLTVYGESFGGFQLQARLADQQIEISGLQIEKPQPEAPPGTVQASGTYHLQAGQYSLQARGERLQFTGLRLPAGIPVRGDLEFAVQGAGNTAQPSLRLDATANELRVDELSLGNVQVSGRLDEQLAVVELQAPQLSLTAKGRLETVGPYPAEFEITADGTDLSRLAVKLVDDKRLDGLVTGRIQGAGDLAEWKQGSVKAAFSDLRLAIEQQETRNDGPLEFSFEQGRFQVQNARLVCGNSSLSLEGSLPLEESSPSGELTLRATLDPEGLLAFVPGTEGLLASGDLRVEGWVRGSIANPEPSLRVALRDAFLFSPATFVPFTDLELDAETRDGAIRIDKASGEWAAGRIVASGEIPLPMLGMPLTASQKSAAPKRARLQVQVSGLKPETTGAMPEKTGATLGLMLDAEATAFEPRAVRATVSFDELRLNVAEFSVAQVAPARISFHDGTAQVEQFELRGPETSLRVRGTAGLADAQVLDLKIDGQTDAGVLTFLSESLRATGDTRFQFAIGGRLDDPQFSGDLELRDGQATLETPALQAERLDIRVSLAANRVTIERFTGTLNGGDLLASGGLTYSPEGPQDIKVNIAARDLFLDFPKGLRTASQADIGIESQDERIVVGGEVRVLEGSFREPLDMESEVLGFLQSGRSLEVTEERNPTLSKIRYNVALQTDGPIVVDNNLARLTVTSNLRLVGTYYRPSLTGRLTLEEGGEIYLAEKKYVIETGRVDFVNENRIEPSVNVLARTRASGYDIELRVIGDTKNLDTTLTSDPTLPEPDILSVLLTGRTLDEARGAGVNVAKEQALSYLTGQVGGRLSRQAREGLGLSQVRIEPNLIAAESDPSVRLTVGQDLRPDLRLIYSMNLADSSDQIYITEYDLTKRFNTNAVKQSDNSYRLGFRHDLQFGGPFQPSTRGAVQKRKIGTIAVTGNPALPEDQITRKLGTKAGKRYDFFGVQKGVDRLKDYYWNQDYLEARVRLKQQKTPQTVDLTVNVEAGPTLEMTFEGVDLPAAVRQAVRRNWRNGVFEAQRLQDAEKTLQRWLLRSRYLQPRITDQVENPSPDVKRVRFQIEPGVRYENVELVFENAAAFSSSRLKEALAEEDPIGSTFLEPQNTIDRVTEFYRQEGYADVKVDKPRFELNREARSARVVVPVREGPLYRFGQISFRGNRAIPDEQLRAGIPLEPQSPFGNEVLERSIAKLEELYWTRGYNDVVVRFQSTRNTATAELDIVFDIEENRQGVVESIAVKGNDAVDANFIRRRIKLTEGGPLNFEQTDRSRKALYKTGVFSLVDFETEPVERPTGEEPDRNYMRVLATVREVRPFKLRYGGFFDTDRGPGAILDFENRNTLGNARVAGLRTRYDSELREARVYFGQPTTWITPATINATAFRRREITQRDVGSDFIADRTGFTLQQELDFKDDAIFTYGYRFERTHTFDREADPDCPLPPDDPFCRFDETFNIAPLTSSFSWDTRDDLLDATRGFFTSHAVEFAPGTLGSDLRFIKYFGQLFKYIALTEPAEIPFAKGLKKSRVVYAGGVRVGLGRGFGGQDLIFSERFLAGGGTTIRGFERNAVGPRDFLGDPAGGSAVFIANNELRFPLTGMFEGVSFVDLGNVYEKTSDFDPFDLRKSAGAGLRVRTPYFLLRLDYGLKLDRKEGESRGAFFFSIGQAF